MPKFIAEIKKVSSKKTASLDMVYQVVFETENPQILELGAYPAETLVDVNVEVTNG